MALDIEEKMEPIRRSSAALVSASRMLRADDKRIRGLLEKYPHLDPGSVPVEPGSETEGGSSGEGGLLEPLVIRSAHGVDSGAWGTM